MVVAMCAQLLSANAQQVGQVLALRDDTAKVRRLSDLCFAYRRIDGDSALLFGNAALALAMQLRDAPGEAQACNDMAIIHMDRSAFGTADSLLRRSLRIREQLKDSVGMGAVHNKMGNIFQAQFKLEDALEENFKALRIFERIGPPMKEALILNNIANLQFNLRRTAAALATHQRAAAVRQAIGDRRGLAESQGNIANVQVQLGDTAAAIGLYEQAIAYFRDNGLKAELAVQLNNLAGVLMAQGHLTQAAGLYKEALGIREDLGEPKVIASSLIGLGGVYTRQGRTAEAKPLLLRALRISEALGVRNERMQALLDLARLYARTNAGDSSFLYHQRYVALRDSVFNADLQSRMAELEARYGTEKKEREIQRQRADIAELGKRAERRRFWLAAAVGGIAVVTVVALLLAQVQRRRARAARDAAIIAERERGLRAVIDSTEAERRRLAGELHDGVGQQLGGLRFRMEHVAGRMAGHAPEEHARLTELLAIVDDAGRDVRSIAHRMRPRALDDLGLAPALGEMLQRSLTRPDLHLSYEHFGIDERLPAELETGVYRIAQELVSNIIKHARARNVSVQLLRNKGWLVLIIEDDGEGMDPTLASRGIGLLSINDRVRVLQGTVEFDSAPGKGTVVTLRVPWRTTNLS
ncbi:MAG: sensor histidine kinase [Flavobacteriales bacterium]